MLLGKVFWLQTGPYICLTFKEHDEMAEKAVHTCQGLPSFHLLKSTMRPSSCEKMTSDEVTNLNGRHVEFG